MGCFLAAAAGQVDHAEKCAIHSGIRKKTSYIAMMSGFGYFYFSLFCIVQLLLITIASS